MKLLSILLLTIFSLTNLFAVPVDHVQNQAYTHTSIVVSSSGVNYITLQDVPAGTVLTSSLYWAPLLSTAPSTDPGDPPASEPDDSNLSNLPTPDPVPTVDIKLKGISTNAIVTSDAWMVAGVTITGGTKKVVFQVQASGTYGTGLGYLADPVLYITDSTGAVVAIVDNWKDGPNAGYDANLYSTAYLAELQSSVYAMAGDEECAVVLNLPEGSYTALVGSNGESSGKAVVAAFDFEE